MEMKVMPMLFQTELVCALFEGRKTVTRRPAKDVSFSERAGFSFGGFSYGKGANWRETMNNIINRPARAGCPVNVGDLIYVRETFMPDPDADHDAWNEHELSYFEWAGCGSSPKFLPDALKNTEHCIYKTNGPIDGKWTPCIHMPRWASRLTLKVTDVRIERVQEITEEQAVKEGMPTDEECQKLAVESGLSWYQKPVTWFKSAWNSIYKDWDQNPYVWVIEFEVIRKNVDQVISEMKVTA